MSRYQAASQPTRPMRVWIGNGSVETARSTCRVTVSDSRTITRDTTNAGMTARARASLTQPTNRDSVGTGASAARRAHREALQSGVFEEILVRSDRGLPGARGGEQRREL